MNKESGKRLLIQISTLLVVLVCTPAIFGHGSNAAQRITADTLRCAPLKVEDADGRTINTASQKHKVIFINFWALSCAPCKAEMPGINRLREQFAADTNVLFLAVDLDHDFANSNAYMRVNGLSLAVYTPSGVVPQAYFHGELPTTVVLDKKGNIAFFKEGEGRYDAPEFIRFIDLLRR